MERAVFGPPFLFAKHRGLYLTILLAIGMAIATNAARQTRMSLVELIFHNERSGLPTATCVIMTYFFLFFEICFKWTVER